MSVNLLILKSGADAIDIDASAMSVYDVVVNDADPDSLAGMASIAADVVLLSEASEWSVLASIDRVRALAPTCKLMVRIKQSNSQALAYLQAGVTGVLDSVHELSQLAEIIHRVCDGEYYLDKNIAQLLAIRQVKKTLAPFSVLSSREFDVFCMLAEGCGLQAIAEQLGISSKTVSNCQTQLKLKLGIGDRRAIKEFAKSHGLVIEKRI